MNKLKLLITTIMCIISSLAYADTCGKTSYYGNHHHGKKTASGQIFDKNRLTAAHKNLPFNTKINVTNKKTGKSIVVVVNDRGPYVKGRILDLSERAASELGFKRSGTASVCYTIIK